MKASDAHINVSLQPDDEGCKQAQKPSQTIFLRVI